MAAWGRDGPIESFASLELLGCASGDGGLLTCASPAWGQGERDHGEAALFGLVELDGADELDEQLSDDL